MNLSNAVECILSGDAILITGSGANYGARNHLDEPFPSGVALAEHLYKQCGESPGPDLQDASELYLSKYSVADLVRELNALLSVKDLADYHKDLYSFPWVRCYSTNYDTIPIIASAKNDYPLTPVTLSNIYNPRYVAEKSFVFMLMVLLEALMKAMFCLN